MPVPESYPVALHAYTAMMKGKTIAIHGLSNRIMLILSLFVPRFLKVKQYMHSKVVKHNNAKTLRLILGRPA